MAGTFGHPAIGYGESNETNFETIGQKLWALERSQSFDLDCDLEGHDLGGLNLLSPDNR